VRQAESPLTRPARACGSHPRLLRIPPNVAESGHGRPADPRVDDVFFFQRKNVEPAPGCPPEYSGPNGLGRTPHQALQPSLRTPAFRERTFGAALPGPVKRAGEKSRIADSGPAKARSSPRDLKSPAIFLIYPAPIPKPGRKRTSIRSPPGAGFESPLRAILCNRAKRMHRRRVALFTSRPRSAPPPTSSRARSRSSSEEHPKTDSPWAGVLVEEGDLFDPPPRVIDGCSSGSPDRGESAPHSYRAGSRPRTAA